MQSNYQTFFFGFLLVIFLLFLLCLYFLGSNVRLMQDNIKISNIYFEREKYLIDGCGLDYNDLLLRERKRQIDEMKSILDSDDYKGKVNKSWVVSDEGRFWGGIFGDKDDVN